HGFNIVAVEADWPDAASLDRHVRHRPAPPSAEPPFRRFPTWMWRNTDVEAFVRWLRSWNEAQPDQARAGVYGLDLYNLSASMAEMGLVREELNIGQLCRERFGKDAALIGFGTHTGMVACASDWDAPMEVKQVNPSRPDSYERLAHDSGANRFLLDVRQGQH